MMKHFLSIIIIILITLLSSISSNSTQMYSAPEKSDDTQNPSQVDYIRDWTVQIPNQNNENQNNENIKPNPFFATEEPIGNIGIERPKDVTSTTDGHAWPTLSHDIQHTGRSPYPTTANPGAELWRIRGGYPGVVWSSPVVDQNNIIYFGTIGGDSALYALYQNGSIKWRYQADGRIWCTPAIAEDGTIYFSTWLSAYFHALNPDGTLKWLFGTGPASSPTIADDGTIYVGADNSLVWALNPNGTQKWTFDTGGIVMGCPAIGPDGIIYIGSEDHYLYALYPNGTMKWRYNTESTIKGSASLAEDGTIYIPSFNSYFYALSPNGTLKWKGYTGNSIAAAGVALADDGTIYVGTEILRAYDPNGTLRWSLDVQGDIYGTVPAVSADGTIYVSAGGSLVAVNPDGTGRWWKRLTIAQIHSSPCIGPDDRVYVGSETYETLPYGFLHAFGLGPLRADAGGPYSGLASHTPVQFTGIAFGGQPPYTYFWEFGDGNTSDELEPSHLYRYIGTYNVTFTVTDNEGNSSSDTTTATITYGPPLVKFIRPESAIYLANQKLSPFRYPVAFGKITIEVNVTHPFLPIERVEFYKWDHLQITDTTSPYSWTWSDRIPLLSKHKIGITVFAYTSETYGYDFIEIIKFF